MILDHRDYTKFDYEQAKEDKNDIYVLGHVVKNDRNEIGVILQRHGNNEYRTDMFGNCCDSDIEAASDDDIKRYRPKLMSNSQSKSKVRVSADELEVSSHLWEVAESGKVFSHINSINQGSERGKFMSMDTCQDVDDGIFPRVSDYTRLANRLENYGVSEYLTWISSGKSKKLVADMGHYTITRESKHDSEAIIRFKDPITILVGVIDGERILADVNMIIGEFTFEWFWMKNGRQDKIANGFEVWFDCKEFKVEKQSKILKKEFCN